MQTVEIPIILCNKNVPKECLSFYVWCLYLTEKNDGWFQLDYHYLKSHTQYPVKKISLSLNYLFKIKLIELKKVNGKQYAYADVQNVPESFLSTFERVEDEYQNLQNTKNMLRDCNYKTPEEILKNA